jgi:glutaredoxin
MVTVSLQDQRCPTSAIPFACRSIRPGVKIFNYWRESVPNILLLVSPSCGACPSAKSLWKQLRVKYSFSYREVDITTEDGRSLADRHSVRAVPATIIDGRLTFVGVPSRESAEKALLLKMKPRE